MRTSPCEEGVVQPRPPIRECVLLFYLSVRPVRPMSSASSEGLLLFRGSNLFSQQGDFQLSRPGKLSKAFVLDARVACAGYELPSLRVPIESACMC